MNSNSIIHSKDSWLKKNLIEVKAMLTQWYEGKILWRDYPTFLVNTKEERLTGEKQASQ